MIRALTSLVCSWRRRRRVPGRGREKLGLGDELDRRRVAVLVRSPPREALRQGRNRDGEVLVAGLEFGQRGDRRRIDAAVAQQLEQAFAPAFALGDDQDACRGRRYVPLQAAERFGRAAVDAEVGQGDGPGRGALVAASHQQLRAVAATGEEFLGLQEDRLGRQDRPLPVVLQEAVALARVGPEALQRRVDLAVQHQRRRAAEVVEDRRRGVEEERQVVLDARGRDAGTDVLVEPHLGRIALHALAPARPKGGARCFVHRKLAARQEPHLGHRVEAALAVGVEGADRIDLVAEQVDPVRHGRAHREQVDQAAAHRVFAGRDDLAHMGVARERELGAQGRLIELLLLPEFEAVRREKARRRQANQCRRRRHQHHVDLAAADLPEGRQALGDQVLVRREGVVGQRFPVREHGHAQLRREERQLFEEPLGIGRLAGEDRRRRPGLQALLLGEACQQQGVGRARRARQREALAGCDGGEGEHEGANRAVRCGTQRVRF